MADIKDIKALKEDGKFVKLEGASNNERNYSWDLRDRKSIRSLAAVREQANQLNQLRSIGTSDKKIRKKQQKALPKLPNISLELKVDEIKEDLFAMTGKEPSRKMNKREKNVQKQIDLILPGGTLETITLERYKVPRNSKKAK